ncbi:MAG: MFS transporter [Pseudomonadota bacterium]
MTVFSSKALNRVYLHGAIQTFAETGGGVFLFVFLLVAGVSVPLILCTIATINILRFVLRRGVLPMTRRWGLRNTLIVGTLLESSSYWLVPWVEGPGTMLVLLVIMSSVGSVIYWTCYHAFVAAIGDDDSRGKQVGVIEALAALVGVIAPAVMSLLLIYSGPKFAFAFVALIQMAAAIPLISTPNLAVEMEDNSDRKIRRFGGWLFFAEGWEVAFTYFLWQIALFVTLSENIAEYGGTMVLAGLFGALMSLAIGRAIDLGHGRKSALIAYGAASGVALLKAAAMDQPWLAVAATAIAAVVAAIQAPVIMARLYSLAQESGCPLRFNMATEGGWDLGSAAGCLIAAGMIWWGVSLSLILPLALLGLGAVAWMLAVSYER